MPVAAFPPRENEILSREPSLDGEDLRSQLIADQQSRVSSSGGGGDGTFAIADAIQDPPGIFFSNSRELRINVRRPPCPNAAAQLAEFTGKLAYRNQPRDSVPFSTLPRVQGTFRPSRLLQLLRYNLLTTAASLNLRR